MHARAGGKRSQAGPGAEAEPHSLVPDFHWHRDAGAGENVSALAVSQAQAARTVSSSLIGLLNLKAMRV
jgi:hypothetical protein